MQVLVIHVSTSRRDDVITQLWEHGSVGILEEDSGLRAYFPENVDVSDVVTPENGSIIAYSHESEDSTFQSKEAISEPVFLGQQFVVLAGSASCPPPVGRHALLLPDSRAFGSGRHESTQLMVEAMETYLRPGTVVLDVGCGSGVLSEVALRLEASTAVMCDTHPDAIHAACQTSPRAFAFLGSVDSIGNSAADIVLANISAKVIDILASDLTRATKPGGLLLLSGFIQDNTPQRFRPEKIFERNGWLCWLCSPEVNALHSPDVNRPVQPFEEQWW
ncbi:MAG: 50S ribosomal protein L11 methyltransferase [Bryobacteraceae bacterium]